jgi:hypothetical protein
MNFFNEFKFALARVMDENTMLNIVTGLHSPHSIPLNWRNSSNIKNNRHSCEIKKILKDGDKISVELHFTNFPMYNANGNIINQNFKIYLAIASIDPKKTFDFEYNLVSKFPFNCTIVRELI